MTTEDPGLKPSPAPPMAKITAATVAQTMGRTS